MPQGSCPRRMCRAKCSNHTPESKVVGMYPTKIIEIQSNCILYKIFIQNMHCCNSFSTIVKYEYCIQFIQDHEAAYQIVGQRTIHYLNQNLRFQWEQTNRGFWIIESQNHKFRNGSLTTMPKSQTAYNSIKGKQRTIQKETIGHSPL